MSAVKDEKSNVLVHCTTAKNIAPTIILAYMMMSSKNQNKHLPLAAALKYVKGKWIGAQPSDPFMEELVELEEELYDETRSEKETDMYIRPDAMLC